ncbi:restriction endonuclease subunit S [Vibrio vulnificus]|uniref:restriction endonuclease subunit S n=1 Tax=Vibrio vulnificus TaxID=672 RepID=UPI0006963FDC|nr:restriction endonuclease subunit S [Vibrio vulnificus]ELA9423751.1 restriction endonuclease subunit S [Vibrio parahaemolyticus]HCM0834970.1 restriction endonuclease subunit S [Vibrio parahaemolyticus]
MSNVVPDGWQFSILGDCAQNVSKKYVLAESKNTRYVGLEHIVSDTKNIRRWGYADDVISTKSEFKVGDTLFGKLRPYLKKVSISDFDGICSTDILVLRAKSKIDSDFLHRVLSSEEAILYSMESSAGNVMPRTSWKDMSVYQFMLPPLSEQKKIAAILTSVDDVIEKTQAQIDKLKDLKAGMMQELLTRGVGVDGKPHTEFKDSPVGRIPKGWDCCLLDKVAKRGSGHTPDKKKPEYWNDGVKWVSLTDSSKLDKLYISDTAKKISQLGIENSSATLHPKGTVVMVRDAGVGKSAIMTSSMAVSQHFMAWVCGEKLDNYFLYYLLQHWKPQFEAIAMGSTIKTIGLPYFKKLQIPVPSIEEQRVISGALKSVDNKMFALERKHKQLTSTKKALMQDLLTGKVRVKVEG